MRFSIVIPTWEQHGYGTPFFKQLLTSINSQSYKDFEVVVTDQSQNDDIKKVCEDFENLNILYLKNNEKRGNSPANLNNGLKNAKGEIIKIMFQDDFFVDKESLTIIDRKFKENSWGWLVNGCCHTNNGQNFFRYMIPSWNDKILEGNNTISSPSVLSFLNQDINYFDENLTMMMDCDYYYSLYKRYGLPCFLENCLIANRLHNFQISRMYNKSLEEEINIIKNKNYEFRK